MEEQKQKKHIKLKLQCPWCREVDIYFDLPGNQHRCYHCGRNVPKR